MLTIPNRIIAASLMVLAGLLFSLLMMEGVLRALGPDWLRMRMREINAGQKVYFDSDADWPLECSETGTGCFRFTPGSEFRVVTREYRHSVVIDEHGGRATNASISDDVPAVPFLGDSFTFGIGVEDTETFVSLLDHGSFPDFLNLGIPGNALPQHIDIAERRHMELGSPPLFLFAFFLGNDFQNLVESGHIMDVNASSESSDLPKETYPTLTSRFDLLERINSYVLHDSVLRRIYLVQWVRHKVLLLVNRASADLMDPIFLIMRKDRSYMNDARYFLEQEILRLIGTARKLQFDIAFVILPDRHQVNSDLLEVKSTYYGVSLKQIDTRLPNRTLTDMLDTHGVPYVDITECMADQDDVQALYYSVDNHFTARGHKAAAACMSPGLEKIVLAKLSMSD